MSDFWTHSAVVREKHLDESDGYQARFVARWEQVFGSPHTSYKEMVALRVALVGLLVEDRSVEKAGSVEFCIVKPWFPSDVSIPRQSALAIHGSRRPADPDYSSVT